MLILVLLAVLASGATLSAAPAVDLANLPTAPADFSIAVLTRRAPVLAGIGDIARRHGVTIGLYGGTIRDLYLGHAFSPISDLDLIYDSTEPNFAACRDEITAYGAAHRSEMPAPDFHFDLASVGSTSARVDQYHTIGITATKVGVLYDGRLLDPTGWGVRDLRYRVFRYFPPTHRVLELENLGRFVRDFVRLPDFRVDPPTLGLLRRSARRFLDASHDDGRRIRVMVAGLRRLPDGGPLVTFPDLINPSRQNLRFLHNGLEKRLLPTFPLDMFMMDLLRTVTQADDMTTMQAGFKTLGVDVLLRTIGLASEADILLDPSRDREAMFAAFHFPGHRPPETITPHNALAAFDQALRRYNYRTLFEMLRSDFPSGSPEEKLLARRQQGFLATGAWLMLNPLDDYGDMVVSLIDADCNLGLLPRAKVEASLDWFLHTYLPFGNCTLQPVASGPVGGHGGWLPAVPGRWGFSPETTAQPRSAAHSMLDVQAYLSFQIGAELRSLYLRHNTFFALLMMGEAEATRQVQALGYPEVFRINACGFARRRRTLLGFDRTRDRVMVAEFDFHTLDQLLNHEARLYWLKGPAGETIDDRQVFVARPSALDQRPTLAAVPGDSDVRAFRRFIRTLASPVDTFFIGFTNPLKQLLTDVRTHTVEDLSLRTGYLPTVAGKPRRLAVALSAFGANYGSLPARLADVLRRHGLQHIVFVGTGGSLRPVVERFGFTIPDSVAMMSPGAGRDGPFVAVVNRARTLPLASGRPTSRHVTVLTPLCETQQRIRELRATGADSVDCELGYIVRWLSDNAPRVSLHALINITDIPLGSDSERQTAQGVIGMENSPVQLRNVTEALAQVVADLQHEPAGGDRQ